MFISRPSLTYHVNKIIPYIERAIFVGANFRMIIVPIHSLHVNIRTAQHSDVKHIDSIACAMKFS